MFCNNSHLFWIFSYILQKAVFGLQRKNLYDENFEKQVVLKANRKLNPKLLKKM